jgi:hypothetical protein
MADWREIRWLGQIPCFGLEINSISDLAGLRGVGQLPPMSGGAARLGGLSGPVVKWFFQGILCCTAIFGFAYYCTAQYTMPIPIHTSR